jgi:signal transduction histidine kinase
MAARVVDLVQDDLRLWRAVNAFRSFTCGYAVLLYLHAVSAYPHPMLGWLVMAAMVVWTVYLDLVRHPRQAHLVADLVLCAGAVLSTIVVDSPDRILHGAQTLPTVWSASAVLAWAVRAGWRGGAFAAFVIAVSDLVEVRGGLSLSTLDSIVLLFLAGSIVGYAVELFRSGRRDLATAVAVEAASRERDRLAAGIHDSVLQVLSYVRRRGDEVGGEAAEIGRLAGEQESRLRALVATGPPPGVVVGREDLRVLLSSLAGPEVTVTGPVGPVLLASRSAQGIAAAVTAALDNVTAHAGEHAKAWVLIEDESDQVTVTVRDDGVGIPAGRLEAAERDGRLGVSACIRARIVGLGGRVDVVGAPGQGTEVELRVPRTEVELRVPRTEVELRVPRTEVELRAPRTEVELRAPRTEVEQRAPRTEIEQRGSRKA